MPDNFKKIYYHWINNLRDWCISRQLWFGHRIPVWYKNNEIYCGVNPPEGDGWEQDPDTLDTWFSSGLWTFSTLGWPEETSDLKTYHPTRLLETGYDILFFWVARMILMSGYHIGSIPFSNVYLHGLVRDTKGRKMSKSLGNIIDPLQMIEKYGADATRLSLIVGNTPGTDMKLSEDKVRAYKHFANKLWNIARFVLSNTSGDSYIQEQDLHPDDVKLIKEANDVAQDATKDIENYKFYLAADKIYHYLWHTFADKIIEESKPLLKDSDETRLHSRKHMLRYILILNLKILHPFMPFVTEEIWGMLPKDGLQKKRDLLMVEPWP